ncbi:shieldin complex subunit 1 isoform X1 [Myiozetetes cayanensis]|uniref:shieldin complex subunit 1 isoform X1 n=2 Tax=Myiozetetes cayanensis TaxID=478635 RepID=UPI002160929E|nr:shieldin complex subunit 1 isoform X1 [Myiozetetes cayanensis]XP_050172765.1 shieldin complex subunit 1 isoform X1 [Myiozetetes cayanensis]XP_050172769.1 shieldin complex subunit 1 isoform X1 [Myiozetetes cayanensis]
MEGTEMSPSVNSEESSVLDLPSICDPAELFVPPCSAENTEELYRSVDAFPSLPTGESNLPSAVPVGSSDEGSEKANVRCYPKARLCEPTEPDNAVLSWMYKRDGAEDPSIRKSLDDFYKMYCKKQPGRMDPTYETASRCLSQKILKLANRDGTKYASRCLQVAQLVLNRDGCKIFPNHPTSACFSKPAEGGVLLEDRKRTPGLSDDILQFLLKQTRAEHSPDVSHEKCCELRGKVL